MKKLVIMAAFVAAGLVNAQEVKFGAKAGLNFSDLTGSDSESSMKFGFNVGGFAEIKLSDKFYLQPELLFSTQGAESESSSSFGGFTINTESTTSLNYINVPIMAKYYLAQGFNVEFGPQIGFLASVNNEATVTTSGPGFSETATESNDSSEGYSSVDFGLNIGLGYDINENIFVNARYNFGLSSVNEEGDADVNNSVISLNFGYKF